MTGPLPQLLAGFAVLTRDRSFLANSLVYSFVSSASFVFITIGADLFQRLFAMPASRFGLLWASLALAFTTGSVAAGALARRYGSRRVMKGGLRLNLLAATVILATASATAPSLWTMVLGLTLLVFANGLVSPLALAGSTSHHPELAGVAAGFSSSIAMLVSMAFAMLAGVVYDGQAGVAFGLIAAACVLAWLAPRIAR